MSSIRLLPIVILAAFALLVLKGISLVTEGAYVLGGSTQAVAQHAAPSGQDTPAAEDPEHPAKMAAEEAAASGHGAPAAEDHGAMSDTEAMAAAVVEPPLDPAERAAENLFADVPSEADAAAGVAELPDPVGMDGQPLEVANSEGQSPTEAAVLERLSDRRSELDTMSTELDTREALVAAAELRLQERVAGLEAIEARIQALVSERKTQDDKAFAALVSMYETMKPGDAASIFDDLQVDVLVRVARAMNPRKMAPVMAKMKTQRAQDLTLRLAQQDPEPMLDVPVDQLQSLPQIVGQ